MTSPHPKITIALAQFPRLHHLSLVNYEGFEDEGFRIADKIPSLASLELRLADHNFWDRDSMAFLCGVTNVRSHWLSVSTSSVLVMSCQPHLEWLRIERRGPIQIRRAARVHPSSRISTRGSPPFDLSLKDDLTSCDSRSQILATSPLRTLILVNLDSLHDKYGSDDAIDRKSVV